MSETGEIERCRMRARHWHDLAVVLPVGSQRYAYLAVAEGYEQLATLLESLAQAKEERA